MTDRKPRTAIAAIDHANETETANTGIAVAIIDGIETGTTKMKK